MYQKLNNVFILNFNFVCENIIICWNNNGELRMIYPINSFTKTNYNYNNKYNNNNNNNIQTLKRSNESVSFGNVQEFVEKLRSTVGLSNLKGKQLEGVLDGYDWVAWNTAVGRDNEAKQLINKIDRKNLEKLADDYEGECKE